MKLNDIKHNHSLTDLLKILIFSILMLIPFIDVGIRCAYVVCNKNAYQSYYGETINENQIVNVGNNLQENHIYTLTGGAISYEQQSEVIFYVTNATSSMTTNPFNEVHIRSQNNATYCLLYNNGVYVSDRSYGGVNAFEVTFQFLRKNNVDLISQYQTITETLYNNYSYLDNVFDYSVNKLTTSELYTWTQQTAIYTGVQTMCTHLGINNSVIPLLLVYWFILTIIYIIIDIVLKLFTMLTHAIGSKTA